MNQQDHEIFMQHLAATDQRPKNGGCEEGCVPIEEWYEPHKHKEELIECFHHCMLSGYEIDRILFYDNYLKSHYDVYTGKIIIKISTEEYCRLWNEALNSFEEWRDNLFRARSKQGPTFEEVNANFIARLPEVDHPTMDTLELDVYYKNEDGTETYLGKGVIGAQGTTAK